MTLEEIIVCKEGQTFDCKSIQIEPKALAIPIVAMANADGGVLAIGVSDKTRRIEGVDGNEECFMRVGDKSKKLNFDERMQLLYDKGERYYEDKDVYGAILNQVCRTIDYLETQVREHTFLGRDGRFVTNRNYPKFAIQDNVHKDVHKDVHKEISERQSIIISMIQDNPDIGRIEMSTKLGVNEKTIRRDLDDLKEKGIVVRVGGRKEGHWEISQ